MTVEVFSPDRFKILFNKKWDTTGLAEATARIDRELLLREFTELRRTAPRRGEREKTYFSDKRNGSISTPQRKDDSPAGDRNRFEEHLAMALWGLNASWPRGGGESFRLLDYQFPLKSAQGDKGIGKIDLLGLTNRGRLIVIELKVASRSPTNRGETPVSTLLQGLRYAAIVYANLTSIACEIRQRFDNSILDVPPTVQILAPKLWWERWTNLADSTRRNAGAWEPEFIRLIRDIEEQIGITIECLALDVDYGDLEYGTDYRSPCLARAHAIFPVLLDQAQLFGPALIPVEQG